jgi:Polymerase beta, Nucleotidyltransferase
MDDHAFADQVRDRLAGLPQVLAVTLGGSRAHGTHRPDSDWDFAIYYRTAFEPQCLRDLGWPGEVFGIGEWGGGVFNGGAWLRIDGRRVDVHYRDLDSIDHELAESAEGRFRIEPLMFHLAGIPSYIVLAELALNRVLSGELPRPRYPAALRGRASAAWWDRAERTFGYALANYAPFGRVTEWAGLIGQAAAQAGHAVLAARGQWVTNDKRLLNLAGLRRIDEFVARGAREPDLLGQMTEQALALCGQVLDEAGPAPAAG